VSDWTVDDTCLNKSSNWVVKFWTVIELEVGSSGFSVIPEIKTLSLLGNPVF
jgi:hypothetical protein